jgi:hypothetical protein
MSFEKNSANTYKSSLLVGKANIYDPASTDPTFPDGDYQLQPRKVTFSATALGSTEKIYVGNQSDISDIALWAANNTYSYKIEELPNQLFSITITLPYDEITNTDDKTTELVQWEITENVVNRDLFDVGVLTTDNTGRLDTTKRYTVPPQIAVMIKNAVKAAGTSGQLNISPQSIAASTNLTTSQKNAIKPLIPLMTQFYFLLKTGVTGVKTATQHLKRIGVFSTKDTNAYDNNPYFRYVADNQTGHSLSSNTNIYGNPNCVIATADLISIFQVDPITAKQLEPSYYRLKSISGPPWNDPYTMGAIAGWLMHSPIRTFLTPTKVRIEQLFEFDEWLDTMYSSFSNINMYPLIGTTSYPPGYHGWPTT